MNNSTLSDKEKSEQALDNTDTSFPTMKEIRAERRRLRYRRRYLFTLRITIYTLVVIAAVSILLTTLWFPVVQVSGSSMEPTLTSNDILILIKTDNLETGDVLAFYYQNNLLLKRIIGCSGDVIDIDSEGNVTVNGELLDEPYVNEKALGECDITFPYQVPDESYFVMGDNRTVSVDSRSSIIGCIETGQVVGKVVLKIWPLTDISLF